MDKRIKALNLAKYVIMYGYTHNLHLEKLRKKWNDDTDLMSRCAKLQIEVNNSYMNALRIIVKLLTEKCRHPKKYHDRTNGIWYCMNCNSDLSKSK